MLLRLLFLFVVSTVAVPHSGTRLATVSIAESDKNAGGELRVVEHSSKAEYLSAAADPGVIAWGNFTNEIESTGWSYLEVTASPQFADAVQARAAGMIEAWLTHELIHMAWQNVVVGFCDGKPKICSAIRKFLAKNTAYVRSMVSGYGTVNPYWHQVGLYYEQLEGLTAGYDAAAENTNRTIPAGDLFWMNVQGDIEDLEQALASQLNITDEQPSRVTGSGSCSALIKLLPGNSDLYAAHDTWNGYEAMLRVLKRFDLPYRLSPLSKRNQFVPGRVMSFSGYPGVLFSMDDFTLTSAGLTVIETTIGNSNADLWSHVTPSGCVLEGIRSMVANRMSSTGEQWTNIFKRANSGTYNNQWMVVDYKLFKPAMKKLKKGLLWILEQIPGQTHAEDMTWLLEKQSFWPSYNSPYFKDIFVASGLPEMVSKFGDWFSYDRTPRARIFKRDHSKVHDVASMTALMRYNNFRHDPLSRCEQCSPPYSAENAISARCDLNPKNGTYPFGALGHRSHGGTDMKLTSSAMATNLEFVSISGPAYGFDLPPFQWSKADFAANTNHVGHPDLWKFPAVKHEWRN